MLSASEQDFVAENAYVPEHVPGYVSAISPAEPYLVGDYLCYRSERRIVFIGYPLNAAFDEAGMAQALSTAISRSAPESVAVTAPSLSALGASCRAADTDRYYRLDLSAQRLNRNVEGMIRRASRELELEHGARIGDEHGRLIAEFLGSRPLTEETRSIFERVPAYVSSVSTAAVFGARNRSGDLVAFDVAEFGARDYAFYQFNFVSRSRYVPGVADLLLHEVVRAARSQGKRYVNLGLGINEGLTRFKRKWGAVPFLDYACCRYRPRRQTLFTALLRKP